MKSDSNKKHHALTLLDSPSTFIIPVSNNTFKHNNMQTPNFYTSNSKLINMSSINGNFNNSDSTIVDQSDNFGSIINNNNQLGQDNLISSDYIKATKIDLASNISTAHNQRHKFSPEEDIELSRIIAINGPKKWDQIALSMPGRTGRQCRDRFQNYLNPSLTNGPWTREEDKLLEQKVKEVGQHWNKISRFFNGRSSNNIKNRWYTYICKQKQKQHQIIEEINLHKNRQKLGSNTAENDHNYMNNEYVADKYINNINNNSSNKYSSNEVSSNLLSNENHNLKFAPHFIDKGYNFDNLTTNTKNEKKTFFPPIYPPNNNIFSPLNNDMFNFLNKDLK